LFGSFFLKVYFLSVFLCNRQEWRSRSRLKDHLAVVAVVFHLETIADDILDVGIFILNGALKRHAHIMDIVASDLQASNLVSEGIDLGI
jgi:hypothetical protein